MNSKIATLIKERRTELNLTQEELAQKAFVSRQAVSSWERGKTQPDFESLKLLSKELDIDIDKFLWNDLELVKKKLSIRNISIIIIGSVLLAVISILVYNTVYPIHKKVLSQYDNINYVAEEIQVEVYENHNGNNRIRINRLKTEILVYPFGKYYVPLQFQIDLLEDELIIEKNFNLYGFINSTYGIHTDLKHATIRKINEKYIMMVYYSIDIAADQWIKTIGVSFDVDLTQYIDYVDEGYIKLLYTE